MTDYSVAATTSNQAMTFIEALIAAIEAAATYNSSVQVAPAAVLWTDRERQWEALLPRLRSRLPLLTLGPYNPDIHSGPAYWIRCMIARTLPEDRLPDGAIPIIYLPGVSRQDIRAIEDAPRSLQPLAELQYRGILWTQRNARDWTPLAFLQSTDGLGLPVEHDVSKDVLLRSLEKLADETIAHLRSEAPLRTSFFDSLLQPDEIRTLLLWLNNPVEFPTSLSPEEWQAFCHVCQRKYGIHPEKDGPISAAEKLGNHQGAWDGVWKRYLEGPEAYPRIPDVLRKAAPPPRSLWDSPADGWPQENEESEAALCQALQDLNNVSADDARASVAELEKAHGMRRSWVWARIGQAPMARALQHISELAQLTQEHIGGPTVEEISEKYVSWGWKADAGVLDALACVELPEHGSAVRTALKALYRPWLQKIVEAFQASVARLERPSAAKPQVNLQELYHPKSTAVLFSDALRFDSGMRLVQMLSDTGLEAKIWPHFTALPTVTPTAKPALSPVVAKLSGKTAQELTPTLSDGNIALTADKFRELLDAAGFPSISAEEFGDPKGHAWTELGAIDAYGHQHGWKISHHLAGELDALRNRITALLDRGWDRVIVITDHGWLLLPGGLPKTELPEHLTQIRKGRCARLKPGSQTDNQVVPWHWDSETRIAMSPGISCYEAGKEYEHGGLSPQECIVPVIEVKRYSNAQPPTTTIEEVTWRGLRCIVRLSGELGSVRVDLRGKAGDASTSVISAPKPAGGDGTVSLAVENDEHEGSAVFVVVLDTQDGIIAQRLTVVGG